MPDCILTGAQIERAVYLDFEGCMHAPPSLAGVRCENEFHQTVFDDALEPAAFAKGLGSRHLDDFLTELLRRCQEEGRQLIAFSQYEIDEAALWARIDLSPVYCDGKRIAKRWVNRAGRGDELEDWSLKSFLRFIGFPRPSNLGISQASSRLLYVRSMLIRQGTYQGLTPTAKAKWTKLLAHNKIDCDGLRALLRATTSPLEPRSSYLELGD
jgi:hypothetical protein